MTTPTSVAGPRRILPLLLSVRQQLASLKLTLVLLGLSMILVFAGTLDQVNLGIWAVQEKYFRSFVVYGQVGPVSVPLFPGGYLVGGLLMLNLTAAFLGRFALTWRKSGLLLSHFGLILLLVGELLTGLWQEDFHLRLSMGETRNYAESFQATELAFTDITEAKFDEVVAIPEALLAGKESLQHPKLPFRVVTKAYYPNSSLAMRGHEGGAVMATAGLGLRILAAPQPVTYRPKERNAPSAFVELSAPDRSLGVYLVSLLLDQPQEFVHEGRTWRIALRPKRVYQPYSLTLLKFSHDRYAGTQIPKNFSSRLRLNTPDGRDDREVLIYMNNPLRYGGLTFYQSGFENNDRTTILQVVRNPSWLIPYVACGLMSVGLLLQFGVHLAGFVGRRRTANLPPPALA
ncbi:MAG: cytochrome c biogenesis protein ResB [Verrucomicrobia bacterium]|nr:cytochrome c biogenesis protein ResB [Verrucomicrobiota bacterium]